MRCKNFKNFPIILVFGILVFIQACSGDKATSGYPSDVGSATFSIIWPASALMEHASTPREASAVTVNCGLVDSIIATITDSSGEIFYASGQWPCSTHSGTIYGIPAGSGLKIVVTAVNSIGKILDRGEQSGITITAGQDNYLGAIPVDSTVPAQLTGWYSNAGTIYQPAPNNVGGNIGLWGRPVTSAISYNLYSSTDGSTYSKIDVQNSAYQNSFLFMTDITANTYFRVTAVTPEGESDYSTPIYLEYTHRNSMPAIPIVSPASTSGATGISRTPTIAWTPPSISGTIAGYCIQLRQVNSFSDISEKVVPASTIIWSWGDSVTYTYVDPFPTSLKANTTYSIGIGAMDSNGSTIATGGIYFTTGQ
jgi:hypothetical protein